MLAREHARADGLVNARDLRYVDAAARVADEHASRHLQAGDRLPAARGNGARTSRHDLATFQERLHARVVFELLESLERREARILVVEADDESDIRPVIVEVIDDAATVRARVHRPAERVLDEPGLDAPFGQLPQFLQAEAIRLWARAGIQSEAPHELLRNAAARAFGNDSRARADFRARCVVGARSAVFFHAHIAEAYPGDGLVGIEQGLRGGEARKNIDAQAFRLLRQQGGELPQRNDEVAVVVQLGRQGERHAAGACQEAEFVALRGYADGRRPLAPLGQERIEWPRLHDRAGERMRAHRGGLLQDADIRLGLELFAPDGAGEPCRPAAHDRD